ncbi:MAG: hypothetical protein CMQ19_10380 [Gammaproteobacteria bacterium]|nr:hypothetical protein [Gammaproteobacteria bacterium]
MKELSQSEIALVSGGINMLGILGGIALAAGISWNTGKAINTFNQTVSGGSLGASIYHVFN